MSSARFVYYLLLILNVIKTGHALDRWKNCTVMKSKFSWVHDEAYYYMIYDDKMSMAEARCLCNSSLPNTRLAIFSGKVDFNELGTELTKFQHTTDIFWVDANLKSFQIHPLLISKFYRWGNGCRLILEPEILELVTLQYQDNHWLLLAVDDQEDVKFSPLCQSGSRPFGYLTTIPKLTWKRLGNVGHMFGFSEEKMNLTEAKMSCEQQAGKVYLATLDTLYLEVSDYILNHYPDRTFWLDARNTQVTGFSNTFEWTTGGIISSKHFAEDPSKMTSSLLMYKHDGEMKLIPCAGGFTNYYICEGNPAAEASSEHSGSADWETLGNPGRNFSFSTETKSLAEARLTCEAMAKNVRLAVLDTLFEDVAEWILSNYKDRVFWVGASRHENSVTDFLWDDGKSLDQTIWQEGDPKDGDCAAHLQVANATTESAKVKLAGTASYGEKRHFICEEVSEVLLEWRLLGDGSSAELFGFSHTQSWGHQWARYACEHQAGDVRLASLDKHFDAVRNVSTERYPEKQFWVDGTRSDKESPFRWGDGSVVGSSMWIKGEPKDQGLVVSLTTNNGETGLEVASDNLDSFFFICQGKPVAAIGDTELSNDCIHIPDKVVTEYPVNDSETAFLDTEKKTSVEGATGTPGRTSPSIDTECSNCTCTAPDFNITDDELSRLKLLIRDQLLLHKRNLSAYLRKFTSADDKRRSARVVGGLGIIVITLSCIFIFLLDVPSLSHSAVSGVRNLREWKRWRHGSVTDRLR